MAWHGMVCTKPSGSAGTSVCLPAPCTVHNFTVRSDAVMIVFASTQAAPSIRSLWPAVLSGECDLFSVADHSVTHIHTHIHTHSRTRTDTHTHTHPHGHTHTHTHTRTHTHSRTRTRTHARILSRSHANTPRKGWV